MLKLENNPMVARFHSLEQRLERQYAGRFDNLISRFYGILSNFGSSTIRPVLWFLGLFAITFLVALWRGATGAPSSELIGWQTGLVGNSLGACLRRAFTLTAQSTLNPLGIFGTKGAVVAQDGWLALWLTLHGLFSAILVTLFVFAVRRRFKIS
jgi:hypothetical protein